MKKSILAAWAAALLMTAAAGCVQTAPPDNTAAVTDTLPPVTETAETVSESVFEETSVSSETTLTTAAPVTESTSPPSSVSESGESDEETEPSETAVSEIINESESKEMLAVSTEPTESSQTTASSQTATETTRETTASEAEVSASSATSEQAPAVSSAPVVIPSVYTGNFSGASVLENDLACVDISDTKNGVILVKYKGSCSKVKVRLTKGSAVYDYDLDAGGSVFPLQSGSGSYNIKVLENVEGKTYAFALDMDFKASVSDEFRPYLIPTKYITYRSSSDCVKKAAELCAGKSGTIDKLAAMFGYVTDNITYDKNLAANVVSGYVPDPDRTLSKGTGICFDYASLFAAMCRSQNIPARLVMGYVRGDVYHAWNEVYTPETGWVTADLFLDTKGWELLDPTFYASADNKDEVARYIGSGSDYSAVYYY